MFDPWNTRRALTVPFLFVASLLPSMQPQSSDQRTRVYEIFRAYLRKNQLRETRTRFEVLRVLYESQGHMDADTLYARLREEKSSVSRATVYNTLSLLLDCNLVVRHQFGQQSAVYEPSFRYGQHDHLICLDCQEILEFCDPRVQRIQDMVAEVYQFDIQRHALSLYGRCRREGCSNRVPA